ncbi:MAG: NUMOD3 domain-containing DNA-binding protein [Patescibacteria group bacterium]
MKTINNSVGQGSFPFRNAYPISDYFTIKSDLDKELKMNQKLGTIYIGINLLNGMRYVGQTTRKLKERIAGHKCGKKKQICILTRAIKKYGIKNFKWISFSCVEEDLDWTEQFLIKELNTLAPNGYNLETGGHENKHHSEITKQKIRKRAIGRLQTEETKQKKREKSNGINNPFYGKRHTEESLIKMRKPRSEEGKQHMRKPKREGFGEEISKRLKGKYIGNNSWNHKLTDNDILLIKKLIEKGKLSSKEIYTKFGISNGYFYKIKKNQVRVNKEFNDETKKNI